MDSSPNFRARGHDDFWSRTRWPRYTFGVGLLAGIFLGWFFHGVVSFIIRFGVMALVVAALIGLFFAWRAWTGRGKSQVTVVRWDKVDMPPTHDQTF